MRKDSAIQKGFIEFFDAEVSGLLPGKYVVKSVLDLPNPGTDNFTQTVTRSFEVQGPQFSIDPAEIHAVFPAKDANGDFSTVVPTVILENLALPWERMIDETKAKVPWLALLVFRADEIEIDPSANSSLHTTTVNEFLKPVPGVLKPAIDRSSVPEGILATSMNSIFITPAVFNAVTPRLAEVPLLTHVREVNTADKSVGESGEDNWFSVVMANRFPQSMVAGDTNPVINYVHLVSLEKWNDYLVDNPNWPSGTNKVQMISLASWRFVSAKLPGETFSELAQQLVSGTSTDRSNLLLRIPAIDNGSTAANRLKLGYTALTSHVLTGEDSFCWYRGPFAAVKAQPLPVTTYAHPSAAMIYDQENGIFDNSYAAAWSIGRLTALADPGFIDSLQQARNKVIEIGTRLLEQSFMPHLAGVTELAQLASPVATRKRLLSTIKNGLGDELLRGFAEPLRDTVLTRTVRFNHLFPEDDIPASHAEQMQWFFQKPAIQSFLQEQAGELGDSLATWLANLALLYNIPFNHLVPDQRMLPVESLRFFYIDQSWIQLLIDGALSVGIHSTKLKTANDILRPMLTAKAQTKVAGMRNRLLRINTIDTTTKMPVAGMLLRSALVPGWPGLAVNATANAAPVNIMRMDHVAPNILLVLWDAVPDKISISQPEQALAFGVNDNWTITRRSLTPSNLGQQLPAPYVPASGSFNVFLRPVSNGIGEMVLKVSVLSQAIAASLGKAALTPAEFALEIVKVPEQISLSVPQ